MITITKTPANLYLDFDYNEKYVKVVKCLSHRIYKNKRWKVPVFDEDEVYELLERYDIPYEVKEDMPESVRDHNLHEPKLELYPEQRECANFALTRGNAIFNMDIGFGKTATALITVTSTNTRNCLIIVPASLRKQWCREIEKFTNKSYNLVNEGKDERRYDTDDFFTVVSFATARIDIEDINKHYWDYVMLDEIVKIKNYKSKTSKAIRTLKRGNVLALSGAILENKLEELYNILNFVRPDIFNSFWDFRNRFLVQKRRHYGSKSFWETVDYKNLDHLREIMDEFVIKKELKNLPEKREITREVRMLKKQKKYHDEIVNECIEGIEVNENPLAKLTALRQVCNAPATVGLNGRSNKIEELKDILEEIHDKKVIVFTQFKKFANLIYDKLDHSNKDIKMISGSLTSNQKEENIKHFKEVGDVLVTTDCISYGMNLQEASVLINMDTPWNPIKLQQRIGRIHRRGQEKKCLIINLISKNSVEERVRKYLNRKIDMINKVMEEDIERLSVMNSKERLLKILKGEEDE